MNSDTFVGNSGYVRAKGLWEADYTLSANTKLVFTGQAQAWLNASNPPAGDYFAAATVAVQFANPDVGPALPFYSRTVSTLDPTRFEEMLMVELVNDSDLALSSHLSVWVETEGSVTAVPEPATWLMLGAGLALTRTLARRRASRGAAAA
ncbi:PEP-CTERM sorting domain-containing protein [Pseudoduganella flava]|uniref:PEP-CTERM sorting domain-containing protein n=2 Tax=Pseudoduganella flava TaxID=871742 RepID=A0ABX6G1U1_9BURK|nr:PEP-CTERM sorting domain-containing protein [Pseudoduganella flava]